MEKEEIYCRIRGKVQGVMYRLYVARHARHLALVGYVKNMQDFTVELVAQGYPDTLQEFIEILRKGPFSARVSGVHAEWRKPSGKYDSFEIVY